MESLSIVQIPLERLRAFLVSARILLISIVAVAYVIAWLEEKFSPHRPYASDVRRAGDRLMHQRLYNIRQFCQPFAHVCDDKAVQRGVHLWSSLFEAVQIFHRKLVQAGWSVNDDRGDCPEL